MRKVTVANAETDRMNITEVELGRKSSRMILKIGEHYTIMII